MDKNGQKNDQKWTKNGKKISQKMDQSPEMGLK